MITIDGSKGEGGGQIIRTALALSLVTGEPFRIHSIRAGRGRPGLLRQHLTAVQAAAEIGAAAVRGDQLGSFELEFRPRSVQPGRYRFAIGSAGSTMLVLQTVLPALLNARAASQITVEGGTHNVQAPTFEYVHDVFLPLLARMGPRVEARLVRHGFFPAGGGRIDVNVQPAAKLEPLELLDRGAVHTVRATALVSRLPEHIARRELERIAADLALPDGRLRLVTITDSPGPGNVVYIDVEAEHIREQFTGFGRRGVPAETVAGAAVDEARAYLESDVPVGPHLADQLLLPFALSGRGAFHTGRPTSHAETNRLTIRRFLDAPITFEELAADRWEVRVGPL